MTGSTVEMLVKSKADRKQDTQRERKISQKRLSFLKGEGGLGASLAVEVSDGSCGGLEEAERKPAQRSVDSA